MPRGLLLMLGSALCFGAMAAAVAKAHAVDPSLSVAMASLIRALVNLVLLVALHWRNPLQLFGDRRPALWWRGLAGGLALLLYFDALYRIGIGEAAFLNQTSAFWVVLLAPLLLKERSSPIAWIAVSGAMVGMFLLSVPEAGVSSSLIGRLSGAASGLLAAFAYLLVRRAGESNKATVIVFYFTLVSTVLSLVLVLGESSVGSAAGAVSGSTIWPASPQTWLWLVSIGILATGGQLLMTEAYREGPAAFIAPAGYAGPVFAALIGFLFLEQLPTALRLSGMILILACGVALPALKHRNMRA